jgi:hypothetical protein
MNLLRAIATRDFLTTLAALFMLVGMMSMATEWRMQLRESDHRHAEAMEAAQTAKDVAMTAKAAVDEAKRDVEENRQIIEARSINRFTSADAAMEFAKRDQVIFELKAEIDEIKKVKP